MEILEIFNTYQDDIQKLFRSWLLLQVMIFLGDGEKTLAELRGLTDATSQTLLPKIRFLEDVQYVQSQNGDYSLTPQGKVISSQIHNHVKTAYLFYKSKAFWSAHYLEALPAPFLCDIGDLCTATVVETSNTNIFSFIEKFSGIIEDAERISVVSSFMSNLHADTLEAKVKKGVPLEMVVNPEIAEELRKGRS